MFKKKNLPNLLTLARIVLIPYLFTDDITLCQVMLCILLRRLSLLLPVLQII